MHITFILQDKSDAFYDGGLYCIGFNNLNPLEKFLYLQKMIEKQNPGVSRKIGYNNAFRDVVELNQIQRKGFEVKEYEFGARRGYKLVSFEIV